MQLIINVPTDEKGINQFNNAFSQVQKTLVKKYIDDLNIDNSSKQIVVNQLLTTIGKEELKNEK